MREVRARVVPGILGFLLVLLLAVGSCTGLAHAQFDRVWNGGNGAWETAANWTDPDEPDTNNEPLLHLIASYGYAEDAATIQDLYLAGRRDEAVAAVPDELVRAISLIGSPSEIAERLAAFATAGVTTLTVTPLARNSAERVALMAGLRRLVG